MNAINIRERHHRLDGRPFELSIKHGWLETILRPETGQYLLANLQVTRQREGRGKLLLQSSIEHAQSLGAEYMESFIISRECLQAMRAVFGYHHITVAAEGKFSPDIVTDADTTSAHLHFPLDIVNNPLADKI